MQKFKAYETEQKQSRTDRKKGTERKMRNRQRKASSHAELVKEVMQG